MRPAVRLGNRERPALESAARSNWRAREGKPEATLSCGFSTAARPSVFSTALTGAESRRLAAWLTGHRELGELWRRAWELADAEDKDESGSPS
jgi:hypothetical protein